METTTDNPYASWKDSELWEDLAYYNELIAQLKESDKEKLLACQAEAQPLYEELKRRGYFTTY